MILLVEADTDKILDVFENVEKIIAAEGIGDFTSPFSLLELVDPSNFDDLKSAHSSLGELSPVTYSGDQVFAAYDLNVTEDYNTTKLEESLSNSNITYYSRSHLYDF